MAERSVDVYAHILSRVEPQELQEQCQRVVRRDAKRTLSKFTHLQGALQQLQEVDAATRHLLAPAQQNECGSRNMLAQLDEILALRRQLTNALDALVHYPPSVSASMKMEESGLDKQDSDHGATAPSEDADKKLIKQEGVATTTKAMKAEPQWTDAQPIAHKRYSAPAIDLSNESDDESPPTQLELKLLDPESDAAKPPTCLEDAQKLWRSSPATQSHQFPSLIKKLRNHLHSRTTRLDPNETQEVTQTIEIATAIGMNPASVRPNDPTLTDLLVAIDQFRRLADGEVPVQFTKIANKFTAYLLTTATAAVSLALGDPYIVQHGEDTVIRVDV